MIPIYLYISLNIMKKQPLGRGVEFYDCFSLFFFDEKWKASLPPIIWVVIMGGRLFYGIALKGRGYSITTTSSTLSTRKAWRLRWWWTLQWSCNRESRPSIFAPCVNSKKFWDSAQKSSSSSSSSSSSPSSPSSLLDSVGFHKMVTIQWLSWQWL